ncbi:hypothetical protein [Thioclava sp. GXIMD2076]|uniref:hypothetical protein n=1 Tax=Thioclava sp. GXIMD2076 TaxID=3131931 RepID=UPI0030D15A3F
MHLKTGSTLNVSIDTGTAEAARGVLNEAGIPFAAAVELFLKVVIREGGLPSWLEPDPEDYERWFRARLEAAVKGKRASYAHEDVMKAGLQIIEAKRSK